MYAQFHKHNQCAEWRHWYSVEEKKSHYCSWAIEKESMVHITPNPPLPPQQQPTSTQSLIPASSPTSCSCCLTDCWRWPEKKSSSREAAASAGDVGGLSLSIRGSAPNFKCTLSSSRTGSPAHEQTLKENNWRWAESICHHHRAERASMCSLKNFMFCLPQNPLD